jgi:hypothetical protein
MPREAKMRRKTGCTASDQSDDISPTTRRSMRAVVTRTEAV